jgi:hypothetical protein
MRTRFQFSLRTLFGVVTLTAIALAVTKTLGLEIVLGFSGLAWSCGFVILLDFAMTPLEKAMSQLPYWTAFLLVPILYGCLTLAFSLFGEVIDQPLPWYVDGGTWLPRGVADSLQFELIVLVMTGVLIAVTIDAAVQSSRPRDRAYYPLLPNVWRGLGSLHVRLILIVGGLIVAGRYADTVIAVWSASQGAGGLVWPPKRVFDACRLLWGLLWLADCASRPNRGTMAAAIGYLLMMWLLPSPSEVLRE